MPGTCQDVLKNAILLDEGDRARLVDALIASFDPASSASLDDAWLAELERRSAELDTGNVALSSSSQVRERARQRALLRG